MAKVLLLNGHKPLINWSGDFSGDQHLSGDHAAHSVLTRAFTPRPISCCALFCPLYHNAYCPPLISLHRMAVDLNLQVHTPYQPMLRGTAICSSPQMTHDACCGCSHCKSHPLFHTGTISSKYQLSLTNLNMLQTKVDARVINSHWRACNVLMCR